MTAPADPGDSGDDQYLPVSTDLVSFEDFQQFMQDTQTIQDDQDAKIADLYARVAELQPAPPVTPPVTPPTQGAVKLWGTGSQQNFLGTGAQPNARRLYQGFSTVKGGWNPTGLKQQLAADKAAGRWSYVSIGPGHDIAAYPTAVDATHASPYVDAFKANLDKLVFLGRHEPGNSQQPLGTPAQFVAWESMVLKWFKNALPGLRIGVCLMEYTIRAKPGDAAAFMPSGIEIDEFCVDGYAHAAGQDPGKLFANGLAWAKQIKKPLVVCEHGQEQALGAQAQIDWLNACWKWMSGDPAIRGMLYWNGGTLNPPAGHNYHLLPDAMKVYAQLSKNAKVAPVAKAL